MRSAALPCGEGNFAISLWRGIIDQPAGFVSRKVGLYSESDTVRSDWDMQSDPDSALAQKRML
jgi:hypothetical protein